jgi:hypothetical protein
MPLSTLASSTFTERLDAARTSARRLAQVETDHAMTATHQPLGHVRAHPAQAYKSQFHASVLARSEDG